MFGIDYKFKWRAKREARKQGFTVVTDSNGTIAFTHQVTYRLQKMTGYYRWVIY